MDLRNPDDVHRVRLHAPFKKNLLGALRNPAARVRRPRPQPVRNADGGYSVVLFVPASVIPAFVAMTDIAVVEVTNISARLRQGPLSAIDAGLETPGCALPAMASQGKAAPHPAV